MLNDIKTIIELFMLFSEKYSVDRYIAMAIIKLKEYDNIIIKECSIKKNLYVINWIKKTGAKKYNKFIIKSNNLFNILNLEIFALFFN